MGWSYLYCKPKDVKQFLVDEFNRDKAEVLECKILLRTAYLAVRIKSENRVTAFVALLDYPRGRNSQEKFGYKMMDEGMGPYESDCPVSILKLLTPLPEAEDEARWAKAWRERCWANHKAKLENRAKRVPGTVLVSKDPGGAKLFGKDVTRGTIVPWNGAPGGIAFRMADAAAVRVSDWLLSQFNIAE
jgi:hypothetical protein